MGKIYWHWTATAIAFLASLQGCGGGGGSGQSSTATASPSTTAGVTATPADAGSSKAIGQTSVVVAPDDSAKNPTDLVYADTVPSTANLFKLGNSPRWLVTNLNAERSAWQMASDGSSAWAAWIEYGTRKPGAFGVVPILKLARVQQSDWSVVTVPTASDASTLDTQTLALVANRGSATAAWVESTIDGSNRWIIRSTDVTSVASPPTQVAAVSSASSGYVSKLKLLAGNETEVFWLKQTWATGSSFAGSSEIWRAVRSGSNWQASLLRQVPSGSVVDFSVWSDGGQSLIAWVEKAGALSYVWTAVVSGNSLSGLQQLSSASTVLEVKAQSAAGASVVAWRASECNGSATATRQDTGNGTPTPSLADQYATAVPQVLTCAATRSGTGTWNPPISLGTLTSNVLDNLVVAARPSGEILVLWSAEYGADKRVASTICTASSCSTVSILAALNTGAPARVAGAATTSGFTVAWIAPDPYAPTLSAVTAVKLSPTGSVVSAASTIRGVFYGSGQSPMQTDPSLVGIGDASLLGWRTERFNTDATSDLNATWLTRQ